MSETATEASNLTLSYDELEVNFTEMGKEQPIPLAFSDIMKHLLRQDLRLTAWEESQKALCTRFASLDEEFFEHVEGNAPHTDVNNNIIQESNPVQFTHDYQVSQGIAPDDNLKQNILRAESVTFGDPNHTKAFKIAVEALQVIDASIAEGEVLAFLVG